MGQMRGLLLVALGVFVLFLVVSGRAKRVPAAWGYLVDGAWADGGAGATPAAPSALGGILGGISGAITGALPSLPKLPNVGGIFAPSTPPTTKPSTNTTGRWPSTGGKPPTGIEAPPMTRP